MRAPARNKIRPLTVAAAVVLTVLMAGCQSQTGDGTVTDGAAASTAPSSPTEVGTAAATEMSGETGVATSTVRATPDDEQAASETTAEETTAPAAAEETTSADATTTATERDTATAQDVIVVSDFTTFTTPAQAAYCIMSGPSNGMAASISCEVAQSSVPPDEELMGVCAAEGIGWFFNFFADTGHGGFFCNHVDGITRGGGNPHYWQDDPWIDPNNVVTLPSGARVAVLDYGRVMRAGDLECSVQPAGLTCQAAGSGHGFTVNSASYTSW